MSPCYMIRFFIKQCLTKINYQHVIVSCKRKPIELVYLWMHYDMLLPNRLGWEIDSGCINYSLQVQCQSYGPVTLESGTAKSSHTVFCENDSLTTCQACWWTILAGEPTANTLASWDHASSSHNIPKILSVFSGMYRLNSKSILFPGVLLCANELANCLLTSELKEILAQFSQKLPQHTWVIHNNMSLKFNLRQVFLMSWASVSIAYSYAYETILCRDQDQDKCLEKGQKTEKLCGSYFTFFY